jgi:hypothetical protein
MATPGSPVKKGPDNRRWCFRCSCKTYVEVDGRRKPRNVSRFYGLKTKKTCNFCMRCQVAFCEACFRPWHDDGLPVTPNLEDSQPALEAV